MSSVRTKNIDGLVQGRRNPIANAPELRLFALAYRSYGSNLWNDNDGSYQGLFCFIWCAPDANVRDFEKSRIVCLRKLDDAPQVIAQCSFVA